MSTGPPQDLDGSAILRAAGPAPPTQDWYEDDGDEIIRIVSTSRQDLDAAVISADPDQHMFARLSVFRSFCHETSLPASTATTSRRSLGILAPLPHEILGSICLHLDVHSALKFTHTNRHVREIVAGVPELRRLADHALDCLRALFRTRLARYISVAEMHSALTTDRCAYCDRPGAGFVFLPTASRCCFPCIRAAQAFEVVNIPFGILNSQVRDSAPILHTIPGGYGTGSRGSEIDGEELCLVYRQHAVQMLRDAPFFDRDAERSVDRLFDVDAERFVYMACMAMPFFDVVRGDLQDRLACRGCVENAAAKLYFDAALNEACTMYDRVGFLEHFRGCGFAKRAWEARLNELWGDGAAGTGVL